MNRVALVVPILILLPVLAASAAALLYQLKRQAQLDARLLSVRYFDSAAARDATADRGITDLVGGIGMLIARSGLLSRQTVSGLEQTLASTGMRGSSVLGLFVGTKVLLLLAMPILAVMVVTHLGWSPIARNMTIAIAAMGGLLAPDWWVSNRHKKYLSDVSLGLPDALDLMVICAEAGLALEAAIARVADEIRTAHPAISTELRLTASELRVAADSSVALRNLGTRTGLDSVKRVCSTLVQTMRYGTPLGDALRVLSTEMRQEILIRFETRAARLPVLLTLPMILFILPCIFLIVGGPAFIQAMQSYKH